MHADHNIHAHDVTDMPGLKGENASPEESKEIAILFKKFETLTREVEMLPNGIRTVTRSSDPEVMDVLVSHAIGMMGRVEAKDDPKILIQSPTLDALFSHGDRIITTSEVEGNSLIITQISEDKDVIAALHTHAAEVTDMVDRGMAAVHERMMHLTN
ncbi:MAG: hypothetical protein EBV97_18945 [Rhodobacteraceae bacterium]|nr:hypothetical protein [Paracoccaceae bacterium]